MASFTLSKDTHAVIRTYAASGKGEKVSRGVYFYVMETGALGCKEDGWPEIKVGWFMLGVAS